MTIPEMIMRPQGDVFAKLGHAGHENDRTAARVLFVIGQLERGGTESHLAAIAPALAARGWQPTVCSLFAAGPVAEVLQEKGVPVISPRPLPVRGARNSIIARGLRAVRAASLMLQVVKRQCPDVVHFFLPASYLIGAPIAVWTRVPVRLMSRRSLNRYQAARPKIAAAERLMHGRMSAVLGNSCAVVNELLEEGISRERVGLIYNGVDGVRFAGSRSCRAIRAQLGLAPEALVLGIVANLIAYKGHRDLLAALSRVRTLLPHGWRLLVIGRDDGIGVDLRTTAANFGLSDNVLFLGPRTDVPDLLHICDIGLSCSHEEGFANAILEGMAAGLPMIVTDVGGNAEAVLDGETGFVVPARDPVHLAEAIARLAADASLRARLGRAGRRRVEEHFTLDRCVAKYEQLYRALLAGRLPADVPGVGIRCAALQG